MRVIRLFALAVQLRGTPGAVIEVTAGGAVTNPTYQFSDLGGVHLANMTASASSIVASTDLETGRGNRVDDLADQLAAAQATIASLNNTIASFASSLEAIRIKGIYGHSATLPGVAISGTNLYYITRERGAMCKHYYGTVTLAECTALASGTYSSWAPFGTGAPHWYGSLNEPNKAYGCCAINGINSPASNYVSMVWNTNTAYQGHHSGWSETHWLTVCKEPTLFTGTF
jgi:hypothetical protein